MLNQEDFGRIISAIETFFFCKFSKILAENCGKKTRHFFLFLKVSNSNKESSDNFDPWRFCRPYNEDHFNY